MSWPIKLRALSLAITLGVTVTESVMGSVPIALTLWYFDVADARTLLEIFAGVVAIVSLSISIPAHMRPPRIRRRAWLGGNR